MRPPGRPSPATTLGARFTELGMANGTSSPDELDAYIKSEIAKWSRVIADANIQALD
jgi:tripartite-type tricarboxylate transporter receptor subunit TctC